MLFKEKLYIAFCKLVCIVFLLVLQGNSVVLDL